MLRVLVIVALIYAAVVSTGKAAEDRLPYGMEWVAPGIVRLSGYNPGGFLARYLVDLETLKRLGVHQLQLDATCASACTVFLRLGNRVCVTDRARIGFHKIVLLERTRFGRRRSPFKSADQNLNDKFLQRLPAKIRTWHGIRGGLPWRMAWLEGEDAKRLIGRCT